MTNTKLPLEMIAIILGFTNNYKVFFNIKYKKIYKPLYFKLSLDNTSEACKKSILTEACKKNYVHYIHFIISNYKIYPSIEDYYLTITKKSFKTFKYLSRLNDKLYAVYYNDYYNTGDEYLYNDVLLVASKAENYNVIDFVMNNDNSHYKSLAISKNCMNNIFSPIYYHRIRSAKYKLLSHIVTTKKLDIFKILCKYIPICMYDMCDYLNLHKKPIFVEFIKTANVTDYPFILNRDNVIKEFKF